MIACANPAAQFESHAAEIEAAVLRVFRSNRYILGPEVEALEREFADYIGTRHAIGVANGTDALEIAVRSLQLAPGDEVITVSHTAVATVAAIEAAGAVPVLVDVESEFFTLDPRQLAEVLTPRTRAVIAVHLYGQAANLDAIGAFCSAHGLALIEDVSQAHGATWDGRRLGSIGTIGCFSCYPTKNLGAIGDGGLITSNDPELARRIRMLREYGWRERYVSDFPGRNSRLDEVQAAILRVKLRHLDADNARRKAIAALYDRMLAGTPIGLPKVRANVRHVYHLYVVTTDRQQKLLQHLKANDIYPGIHYPVPVHVQGAYAGRIRTAASMRVTERLAAEVLSLPMYPQLESRDGMHVAHAMQAFFTE